MIWRSCCHHHGCIHTCAAWYLSGDSQLSVLPGCPCAKRLLVVDWLCVSERCYSSRYTHMLPCWQTMMAKAEVDTDTRHWQREHWYTLGSGQEWRPMDIYRYPVAQWARFSACFAQVCCIIYLSSNGLVPIENLGGHHRKWGMGNPRLKSWKWFPLLHWGTHLNR